MLIESFSGVRGVFTKDLTKNVASDYALAFSWFLQKKLGRVPKIVIGRDTRSSGAMVQSVIIRAISIYAKITTLGIASTPATEFMTRSLKADGGIIITASHNEPEFNGIKFLQSSGAVLCAADMEKVIKAFHSKKHPTSLVKSRPVTKSSVTKYSKFILSYLTKKDIALIRKHKFSVVFDANGGSVLPYVNYISRALSLNYQIIGKTPGKFHRTIEPTEKSLAPLAKKLSKSKLAFAFDCDADRAELVYGGRVLSGQYVLALVVQSELNRVRTSSNFSVVINDATSQMIVKLAKSSKHRVSVHEVEVGETNVVSKMEDLAIKGAKNIVGGEGSSSGGIVPPSKCRDGLLSMVLILRLVVRSGKTLDELISVLPSFYTLRKNFKTAKSIDLDAISSSLKKRGARVVRHGGKTGSVKGFFNGKLEGFVWFRASKTEKGLFRVISDSKNKAVAEKLLSMGFTFLKNKR